MMETRDRIDSGWLSTALAVLCPLSAVTATSLGAEWLLAGLLWTLGATCPIAWIAGKRRVARQVAEILAAAGDTGEERAA